MAGVLVGNVEMAGVFGMFERERSERREQGSAGVGPAENFFIVDQRRQAWTERGQPEGDGAEGAGLEWARRGGVPRSETGEFSLPLAGIVRPLSFYPAGSSNSRWRTRTARSSHFRNGRRGVFAVNSIHTR